MERLFVIGAAACLAVSWFYILFLRAKVRDCMTYIHNRLDKANRVLASPSGGPEGGSEVKRTANSPHLGKEEVKTPAQEKATMDGKPKLIVGGSGSPQPLHYLCSHCLRPFYLSGDQPPKEAVAELLFNFGEYVEREHPNPGPDSITPREADRQDSH